MISFYLHKKLQCSAVLIVADNAKMHLKKSSGRREQFGRSHSEPVISSRNGLPASTGNKCHQSQTKNGLTKPRPGMCRWNSFTHRSPSPVLVKEETTNLTCNLRLNAAKPVRRGSWGKLDVLEQSRKSFNGKLGLP